MKLLAGHGMSMWVALPHKMAHMMHLVPDNVRMCVACALDQTKREVCLPPVCSHNMEGAWETVAKERVNQNCQCRVFMCGRLSELQYNCTKRR